MTKPKYKAIKLEILLPPTDEGELFCIGGHCQPHSQGSSIPEGRQEKDPENEDAQLLSFEWSPLWFNPQI